MSKTDVDECKNVSEDSWLTKVIHHLLTPGSALTSFIWVMFNTIMVILFAIWLVFVTTMPDSVHVWIFGALGAGLAASTNWLMYLVFNSGLNYNSEVDASSGETSKKAHTNNTTDENQGKEKKVNVSV